MTYVLIHGAGDVAWYWHLVAAELGELGHEVVAVDLPCDDESAGWSDYADTVVAAIGERAQLVVVAGMVPAPGESANDYWANTGYKQVSRDVDTSDTIATFYQDVPRDLAKEAIKRSRQQAKAIGAEPWPLQAWPNVPVKFLLCRDDHLFPADWLRKVVRDRLGIEPDEIDSGHCPALAHPKELANRLEAFRIESVRRPEILGKRHSRGSEVPDG